MDVWAYVIIASALVFGAALIVSAVAACVGYEIAEYLTESGWGLGKAFAVGAIFAYALAIAVSVIVVSFL